METSTYQLPRRLSSRVNELISFLKSRGYSIREYRSWSTEEDVLYLSITSGHQINLDEEMDNYLEQVKRERVKITWRVA
mgnify:CR=1 FL=1